MSAPTMKPNHWYLTWIIMTSLLLAILGTMACKRSASEIHEVTNEHAGTTNGEHEEFSIDSSSGLVQAKGINLVKANCLNCHSSKMILQNRASRQGWEGMIRWMQEKHRLWDLGSNEGEILDYLAQHYAPDESNGRRQNLAQIQWYNLVIKQ